MPRNLAYLCEKKIADFEGSDLCWKPKGIIVRCQGGKSDDGVPVESTTAVSLYRRQAPLPVSGSARAWINGNGASVP